MDRNTKIGVAFLCVLGTPFALAGIWVFSLGLRQLNGGPGSSPVWLPLIFGITFGGIGFGLIYVAISGSGRQKQQAQMQAQHPEEPWLWRADWAEGRVNSKTRGDMVLAWVWAIFWNLISAPMLINVFTATTKPKGLVICFALMFPAVGVYLLIRAIGQTIAYAEFGKTYFAMASVPGVIGRDLKGTIFARLPHSPDHSVHLRLSSVHREVVNSGESQSTVERILWREEADLDPAQLCVGPVGSTIPVAFHIPLDAQPTEKISAREEFVWVLEALADVPGVKYHDIFEVPVFRTKATPTKEEAAEKVPEFAQEFVPQFAPAGPAASAVKPQPRMTVKVQQRGVGTEFYFAAARNRDMAAIVTGFAGMTGVITYVMARTSYVPVIFPIVVGFFSVVLTYVTVQMWFGTTRVVIGRSLRFQSGLLGGGKVREIPLAEVASIDDVIKMQQGGATGTPYYDIVLKRRDGGSVTLGGMLVSKYEADWVVGEMRRLAGIRPKSAAASLGQR